MKLILEPIAETLHIQIDPFVVVVVCDNVALAFLKYYLFNGITDAVRRNTEHRQTGRPYDLTKLLAVGSLFMIAI